MKGNDVNAKRQKESQEGTMGTNPAAHQTHPSSSLFICPYCGEGYYEDPDWLISHLQRHHLMFGLPNDKAGVKHEMWFL